MNKKYKYNTGIKEKNIILMITPIPIVINYYKSTFDCSTLPWCNADAEADGDNSEEDEEQDKRDGEDRREGEILEAEGIVNVKVVSKPPSSAETSVSEEERSDGLRSVTRKGTPNSRLWPKEKILKI